MLHKVNLKNTQVHKSQKQNQTPTHISKTREKKVSETEKGEKNSVEYPREVRLNFEVERNRRGSFLLNHACK